MAVPVAAVRVLVVATGMSDEGPVMFFRVKSGEKYVTERVEASMTEPRIPRKKASFAFVPISEGMLTLLATVEGLTSERFQAKSAIWGSC